MGRREFIVVYYSKHWDRLFNESVQGKGSRYFHKTVEKYWENHSARKILEVGAGYGSHFPFFKIKNPSQVEFDAIDIRVFPENFKNIQLSTGRLTINWFKGDIENLPFSGETYDRIISSCLFHHIDDPLQAFQELRRVTKHQC